jgi:hypothetical protein
LRSNEKFASGGGLFANVGEKAAAVSLSAQR